MMRRRSPETEAKSETTPRDALKAYENKLFGDAAVYHNGKIEDGVGSLFERLSPEQKAHHVALREIVAADDAHKAAVEELDVATARLKAAVDAAAVTAEKAG